MGSREILSPEVLKALTPFRLGFVAAVILIVYAAVSVTLAYHWRNYSFNPGKIRMAIRLYFVVSFFLIATLLVSLGWYEALQ